ncbi:MAG: peptide chain release factor N(5)-glutamine methyltransferase [Cyanobacteria bacterium J06627_32]
MTESTSGQALYQWRQRAIDLAKTHSIDPEEVDWLLQSVTSLSGLSLRLDLYRGDAEIPVRWPLSTLTQKWSQRTTERIPVQYLIGETPWRHFSILVSPAVLIPRPETELIIDIAETLLERSPLKKELQEGHWTDLGTGSGAIALGLTRSLPNATIHAVDISPSALVIAKNNAQKNHLANQIHFHEGSWLSPLTNLKGKLSGIIANPPYIPSKTIPTLQPEVAQHEPHLALDGGPDGLDCLKVLIQTSSEYLRPGGIWITELMLGQAKTVTHLLTAQGTYEQIQTHSDLSGIDRFVSARKTL